MKYIVLLLLLSLLVISGCGYSGQFSSEASSVCTEYCSERGMSYDAEDTTVWKNSIECSCNTKPIMREEYKEPETRSGVVVVS